MKEIKNRGAKIERQKDRGIERYRNR